MLFLYLKIYIDKTYVPKGTTLNDIIHMIDVYYPQICCPLEIVYRTTVQFNGEQKDVLDGSCEWDGHELLSKDGCDYSLNDEISAYLLYKNGTRDYILSVIRDGG